MDENADASQAVFKPPPENWRRPPGRPRTTWMKNIHDDLSSLDLEIHMRLEIWCKIDLWRLTSLHSAMHSQWCMLLLNWIFVSGLVSCYYYKHDCMTLLSLTLLYLDKLFLLVAEWHRLLQHCHVVVSERSDRSRHVVVGVGQKLQQVWQLCLDGLLRYPCISLVVALHQSIDNGTKRERHTQSEFARNCSKFFYTQRHTTLDTV